MDAVINVVIMLVGAMVGAFAMRAIMHWSNRRTERFYDQEHATIMFNFYWDGRR